MDVDDDARPEGEPPPSRRVRGGSEATARRLVRRRPTRLQLVVLALVTLLSFGPIFAAILAVRSDEGPTQTLIEAPPPPADGALVSVTITGVGAQAGELRARINVLPPTDLISGGQLTQDLALQVNDTRGPSRYEFVAGEPIRPVDVTLALVGGSVIRYPFDQYSSVLVLVLETAAGEEGADTADGSDALGFVSEVISSTDEFEANATRDPGTPDSVAVIGFDINRKTTTSAYAVWMMVLMWGLAIGGVLIVWAITIWGVELPIWSFAYFVGVLFALPQLRELLPGRPPPGTVLDFVAFYWSIAIVGVSLIACLAIWIQRVRPARGSPDREDEASAEAGAEVDP